MPQTPVRPRTSGGPRRRPAARRSHTGSARPAAPRPSNDLELALDAAAAAPAPEPREFGQFGLPQALVTTLARREMLAPFAIQTRVLPDALAGRDVLGRASTGSGKTLAFGLPVLARLEESGARRTPKAPRALIIVPTRELARQVADAIGPLAQSLGQRVTTVVGGLSMGKQIDQLSRGIDVLVATPGRLIDLMERRTCDLSKIEITVLDEADHLADLGFLPAVRTILDATPAGTQRLLLSATLDGGVDRLVRDYLTDPALHAVAAARSVALDMEHKVFAMHGVDKTPVAAELAARPGRTLFFVRTKHGADRLAKQLERAGVEAAAIHGNRNQNQRQRALDDFAAGSPRVLVATDVAARGIHVDDVDLVVHFDLPADHKDYVHRSGRTARAGASGTVVAFVQPDQRREIIRLHKDANVNSTTVEVTPGHDAVREIAATGTPIVVVRPRRPEPASERRSGAPKRYSGGQRSGGPSQGRPQRRVSRPAAR